MKHKDRAGTTVRRSDRGKAADWTRRAAVAAAMGGAIGLAQPALAATDINAGSTVNASALGSAGNGDFKGGTLKLDTAATIANNFTVENVAANTIDIDGNAATLSGVFSGAGPLTFTDSVGGGNATISNSANTFTGITTINSGATLSLSGAGMIATSAGVVDNGTFNIAPTTAGASIISLSGAGTVALGTQTLTVTSGAGTFSGIISGTGSLAVAGGTQALSGANTYSGGTTISAGTLQIGAGAASGSILGNVADAGTLAFDRTDDITFGGVVSGTGGLSLVGTGNVTLTAANTFTGTTTITSGTLVLSSTGSIAGSSVADSGVFDISQTAGASIKSLLGTGTVQLGAQTLTLTAGSGTFSGVIAGSGNLVIAGGTELLSGVNTYTGTTTVTGGTLALGSATVANNITDDGTVAFQASPSGSVAMSGVISGTGAVNQITGNTTLSAAQTYTGLTTISGGTLALSGAGSIASSSGLVDNGTFEIDATTSDVALTSLSGSGSVLLGGTNLILSNASGTFSGVISGSGGLEILGGKETLAGANTLTGATTIAGGATLLLTDPESLAGSHVADNGTLDISSVTANGGATTTSIVSLGGTGAVLLGPKTLILTGAADTFSGTISGTGGLTVTGGTETLTGANTYTGTTTIVSGTLALAGAGSLASTGTVVASGVLDISGVTAGPTVTLGSLGGTGTVVLGAENLNLSAGSTTFTGAISGTGQLIVSGGTQVLSGTNSYTGGTAIIAGTLQIGAGTASGSIVGNVADGGTLAFDRTDSSTFGGTISGTGSLVQAGSGTTILTADNTYAGGTTISAGTLQIGNGAASGAITGDVTDNGTLAFGRSDTTTFAGTISGTGGVTQVSGTTVLTAIENYTGATVIDAQAGLTLTGTASIASSSGVTDNGTLDVSATTAPLQIASLAGTGTLTLGGQTLTLTSGSGAFSGTISGTGGVTLTGGMTQTLSGTNTYTGATVVNGGTLAVNGSIASSSGVTVNSGGTLAGSGTVSGVVLASGAKIAPGSGGSGTLNVNGSVAFSAGSGMVIFVNSAGAGKLSASGAEALAGTLSVTSIDGTFPLGQKLTVLTAAGGVTGTFSLGQVTGTGAEFSSALSYDANDVYLQINLAKLSPLLPAGSTVNETNAIGGIDAAIAAGDAVPAQFEKLGSVSGATLQADAGQFASEVAADATQVSASLFNPFVTAIFDHVAGEQPTGSARSQLPQHDQVWATGLNGTDIIEGDSAQDTHRLRANLTGFVAGGEWTYSPSFILGAAVSAGTSNYHLADSAGTGKVSAVQLGVYGLMQFSRHFYGSFVGALALDDVTTNRTLTVSGTDALTAKFNGRVIGGRYETGVEMGWITPYVALQDVLYDMESTKEAATSGSNDFALSYAGQTTNTANFELGVRQRGGIALDDWTLTLSDRLAWQHDLSATPTADAAFAALPGSTFTSEGVRSGRNAAVFSLGAGLDDNAGFGVDLHFDSAITSKSQAYTEMGELKYAW